MDVEVVEGNHGPLVSAVPFVTQKQRITRKRRHPFQLPDPIIEFVPIFFELTRHRIELHQLPCCWHYY